MIPFPCHPLWLALSLGAGLLLVSLLPLTAQRAFLIHTALLLITAAMAAMLIRGGRGRYSQRVFSVLVSLFMLVLGIFAGYLQESRERVEWSPALEKYQAVILSEPRVGVRSVGFRARILGSGIVQLWIPRTAESEQVETGQGIAFITQMEQVHNWGNPKDAEWDYGTYLHHHGVSGMAYVRHWVLVEGLSQCLSWGDLLQIRAQHLSLRAERLIREMGLGEDFSALLSAMLLGRKGNLPDSTRTLYQQVGASHILALSGLHLSILLALFVYLLMRVLTHPLLKWVLGLTGLFLIWGFAMLTGFSPSLVRASVMTTMLIISVLLGRGHEGWTALGVAALLMMLVSPRSIYDIGFQLSFAAMSGLFLFDPILDELWHPSSHIVRLVWGVVRISIAAQLGTLPFIVYYFHQFPLLGVFFSVPFVFLASWVIYGALFALILHLLGTDMLVMPLQCLLATQQELMERFADVPGVVVHDLYLSLGEVCIFYLLLLCAAWLFKGGFRIFRGDSFSF